MVKRVTLVGSALTVAICVCFSGLYFYGRWQYPYGGSHSCDTQIYQLLLSYADNHDGEFPSGEATPEASLSLLARSPNHADGELLRGKTVPKELVESILARGELLGPETCGWHYIEGLRKDDDPRIALFWDKVGLGHNGQRLPNGDRVVTRIGDAHETIPGPKWTEFIEEQRILLEKLPEVRKQRALHSFRQ